jgi:ubiquinone/menaquinone biosynthesis C-methylase UbiE
MRIDASGVVASLLRNTAAQPDPGRAIANYRRLASGYDATCGRIEALRSRAMAELALKEGDVVFDIACGTGPALPALAAAVGPTGRVVGVELSPDMAELARQRVAGGSLSSRVRVVQGAVEDFEPEAQADALFFSYAHDVLQSPLALDRLLTIARPGARIVLLGMKTLPWLWGWPVNALNLFRARCYLTTYANLDQPWRPLAERGVFLRQTHSALWGSAYIAAGNFPAVTPASASARSHLPPPALASTDLKGSHP